jgi:hypothetical protein
MYYLNCNKYRGCQWCQRAYDIALATFRRNCRKWLAHRVKWVARGWTIGIQFLTWLKFVTLPPHPDQLFSFEAYSASYPVGTRGSFPRVKWPEYGTLSPCPISAFMAWCLGTGTSSFSFYTVWDFVRCFAEGNNTSPFLTISMLVFFTC